MKHKSYYQLAGSFCLLLVVFLGYLVKFYPSWLTGFDTAVTAAIRALSPQADSFFLWITKFGNPLTVIVLALVLLFVFYRAKWYAEALWFVAGLVVVSGGVNPLLKLIFSRERPTLVHMVTELSKSFPSGHAVTSMLLYGVLLFIGPRFFQNKLVCRVFQSLIGLLILGIGVSRIYLGVHFPSDIIAGFSLGGAWLLLTYPYYEKTRFVWRFKSKQH